MGDIHDLASFRVESIPQNHPARLFWERQDGPADYALDIYRRAGTGDDEALMFYTAWRMVTADIHNSAKLALAKHAYKLFERKQSLRERLKLPFVCGAGRDTNAQHHVVVYTTRKASDDEIQDIHDTLQAMF